MKQNQTKNSILFWEIATNIIRDIFVKKYFGKDLSDVYWIADEVGSVLAVNDYFFNLDDMIGYLRYHYSSKMMFEHYQHVLDIESENINRRNDFRRYPINIKNYKKLKK